MILRGVKHTLRKRFEHLLAQNLRALPGRVVARRWARARLAKVARPFDREELAASALIVAPHPDDETLGCGGLMALKRREGADVSVVVLTDGARSHVGAVTSGAPLAARRAQECVAALARLGVEQGDVVMLGLPDGELKRQMAPAIEALARLLKAKRPRQLFVPHVEEPPDDHRAAHEIALAAVEAAGLPISVFAYPVWLWWQWPWVPIDADRGNAHEMLVASWRTRFGLRWTTAFDRVAQIAPVESQKRFALEAYASQMQRAPGHAHWPTLPDVSGGQFLRCFFEGLEPFATVKPS